MALVPGVGALRTLVIALRIDDAGLSRGVAVANARVGLLNQTLGSTNGTLRAMQTQLAIVAFTAGAVAFGMVREFNRFEKTMVRAATATDGTEETVARLSDQTLTLARNLRMDVHEASELTKHLQFMGVRGELSNRVLADAAGRLSLIGDVAAPSAAQGILKLAQLTARSDDEFRRMLQNSDLIASQIEVTGTNIAATIPQLVAFLEKFQAAGVASRFTTGELVSLAGALANVDAGQKALATTAIIRVLSLTGDQAAMVARFMGITADEFTRLQNEDPVRLFQDLFARLENVRDSGGHVQAIIRALGIADLRNMRAILGAIGSSGKLTELLAATEEQERLAASGQRDRLAIFERSNEVLSTAAMKWAGLKEAMQEFAIVTGGFLSDILLPIVQGLTRLVGLLVQHKGLLGTLTTGAVVGTGLLVASLAQAVIGGRLVGGALALGGRGLGLLGAAGSLGVRGSLGALAGQALLRSDLGNAIFTFFQRRFGIAQLDSLGIGKGAGSLFAGAVPELASRAGAGRMAGMMLGLGRALAFMTTPVGILIGLLGPLAGLFKGIGDALAHAGRQGGLLGLVLNVLAIVFKGLALAGRVINAAFEALLGFLDGLFNHPLVKAVLAPLNSALAGAGNFLDSILPEPQGATATPPEGQPQPVTRGEFRPGVQQNNTFIISAGNPDTVSRVLEDVARRNASGISQASFTTMGAV